MWETASGKLPRAIAFEALALVPEGGFCKIRPQQRFLFAQDAPETGARSLGQPNAIAQANYQRVHLLFGTMPVRIKLARRIEKPISDAHAIPDRRGIKCPG